MARRQATPVPRRGGAQGHAAVDDSLHGSDRGHAGSLSDQAITPKGGPLAVVATAWPPTGWSLLEHRCPVGVLLRLAAGHGPKNRVIASTGARAASSTPRRRRPSGRRLFSASATGCSDVRQLTQSRPEHQRLVEVEAKLRCQRRGDKDGNMVRVPGAEAIMTDLPAQALHRPVPGKNPLRCFPCASQLGSWETRWIA